MTTFALQARWVLPAASKPIEHGVVTISDGRIVAVGAEATAGVPVEDLGEVVLLPGLVNAHTHLEFSDLQKPLGEPGSPLPDWIRLVISSRKQQQHPQSVVQAGIDESVRAGVTTLGEISTSPFRLADSDSAPEVIAFQEVIGFSAARADSVFADLQDRLQAKQTATRQGISPHAPYTVHPRLVERLVELARTEERPIAMHLAESREELQLLQENSGPFRELLEERSMWDDQVFRPPLRPLDYLQVLAQAPRALVVHGNYLTTEEIDFLARQPQMSVIYCPRTHAYFGHQNYPLQQMLDAGVTVAVGTDSRASNPDLSLLAELRFLRHSHPEVPPSQVLTMGTTVGAKALGLDATVGSLEVGKLANLMAVPCESEQADPYEAVLLGDQPASQTWIRGKLVHSSSL